MDFSPSADYAAGRRYQRSRREIRQETRTEIAREMACTVHLLQVNDDISRRGVEDAFKRLHALDSFFTTTQRNQLAKLEATYSTTT